MIPTTPSKHSLDDLDQKMVEIIRHFAEESKQLLQERVVAEYLFGSYATKTQTPLSDIDILILVKDYTSDLQWQMSGLASDYSLEHDVYISPIVKDMDIWEKNRHYGTLFYQEIMQHGIPL